MDNAGSGSFPSGRSWYPRSPLRYAENRLSLLSWKKGEPLVRAGGEPPTIVVPLLQQHDWVVALAALVEVESWESCLLELFRNASMLVAFVQEAYHHGRWDEAELGKREETALLQESLQHLFALFEYVALLSPKRGEDRLALPSHPGQLRLYGGSPAQLRDWYQAMYLGPLRRLVQKSRQIDERDLLADSAPTDGTADFREARQILYGRRSSVGRMDSLRYAFGDLPPSEDQPLPGSSPGPECERQHQRVSEILSILDDSEHFATPLNACLTACTAYLKDPSPPLVWEIAATLPDLQFLLEVLGVDLSRLQ